MGGNLMYQVKCSICKRAIGFYGFGKHVAMHKRQLGQDCYIKNKPLTKKSQIISKNRKLFEQEETQ